MIFKNSNKGKKPNIEIKFKWKDKELEIVREFCYLGYTITDNNRDEKHILV